MSKNVHAVYTAGASRIRSPTAQKVLPARKVLRRVCVLQNPLDFLRVRTEAVLTTYGSPKIAHVLARRQHVQVFARTVFCKGDFNMSWVDNDIILSKAVIV